MKDLTDGNGLEDSKILIEVSEKDNFKMGRIGPAPSCNSPVRVEAEPENNLIEAEKLKNRISDTKIPTQADKSLIKENGNSVKSGSNLKSVSDFNAPDFYKEGLIINYDYQGANYQNPMMPQSNSFTEGPSPMTAAPKQPNGAGFFPLATPNLAPYGYPQMNMPPMYNNFPYAMPGPVMAPQMGLHGGNMPNMPANMNQRSYLNPNFIYPYFHPVPNAGLLYLNYCNNQNIPEPMNNAKLNEYEINKNRMNEKLGFCKASEKLGKAQSITRQKFISRNGGLDKNLWLGYYSNTIDQAGRASIAELQQGKQACLKYSMDKFMKCYNHSTNLCIYKICQLGMEQPKEAFEGGTDALAWQTQLERPAVKEKPASMSEVNNQGKWPIGSLDYYINQRAEYNPRRINGEYIPPNEYGSGWEYSRAAFRYYHLQPILFQQNVRNFIGNQQHKGSFFTPGMAINHNYNEYKPSKRSQPEDQLIIEDLNYDINSNLWKPNKRIKRDDNQESSLEQISKPFKKKRDMGKNDNNDSKAWRSVNRKKKRNYRERYDKKNFKNKKNKKLSKNSEMVSRELYNKIDYTVIKKGSEAYKKISENFSFGLEELLKYQDCIDEKANKRTETEMLADLTKLTAKKTFTQFFNKTEPKVDFKKEYEYHNSQPERASYSAEHIRGLGRLNKLIKQHFGLICSLEEIECVLKKNRGIKVVERMIEYKNKRIEKFILSLREK